MVLITIALRAVTKGLLYITGISPKLPCNNQAPAGSRIFNLGFSGKDLPIPRIPDFVQDGIGLKTGSAPTTDRLV